MKAILTFYLFFCLGALKAQSAIDYAVPLQAIVVESPASITLSWPLNTDTACKGYRVFKKLKTDSLWTEINFLAANASRFTDTTVHVGDSYEYYLRRIYTKPSMVAHGYIFAGIRAPEITYKGKMLLMVDQNYSLPLAAEIEELKMDLVTDGWQVKCFDIARSATVKSVKDIILNEYKTDSNTKAVYLLGHIPVPYSGGFKFMDIANYPPDAHSDHEGAWPADVYYASMDENLWTDTIVNTIVPPRPQNDNVPRDGKFDLMHLYPHVVQLEVGRVDLTSMPVFGINDTLLTKRYLKRAHDYKHALLFVKKRALVADNLGVFGGEAFAASGWRNFSTMYADSVFARNYFDAAKKGNYQFAFGCGGGSFTSCNGIGSSGDFNNPAVDITFTTLFGSYFGDWDSKDNFLRAPLCAPKPVLASMWNGRPHWHLQHMSLGENIGYSTRLTQSNSYLFSGSNRQGYYNGLAPTFIHIALMGDPSLRLHPLTTPSQLKALESTDSTRVKLSWKRSRNAHGYVVLRSHSLDGKFLPIARLTGRDTTYTDKSPDSGMNYYMVRSLRLENTPSGTYYNLSLGVIDSAFSRPVVIPIPASFIVTVFPNPTQEKFTVSLENWNNQDAAVIIYDYAGRKLLEKTISMQNPEIWLNKVTRNYYFIKISQGKNSVTKKLLLMY